MSQETKQRLLDAAESLFSERGIRDTSLRAITRKAKANLAAVNYHFGSKEALIRAVLDRRLEPLNRERLERLERYEEAAGAAGPAVEEILEALVTPAFQLGHPESQGFAALLGRLHFEQDEAILDLMVDSFREVQQRFLQALRRALPELSPRQLAFRFHFAIGAMAMVVVNRRVLQRAARDFLGAIETENVIERLIGFLAAGFRAPAHSGEAEDLDATAVGLVRVPAEEERVGAEIAADRSAIALRTDGATGGRAGDGGRKES